MSTATLSGRTALDAECMLPKWGAWYATVAIDGEHTITGATELKIADLTLKGTVLSGGPAKGRSAYRIVGGAGGWGKSIAAKSYANDAGVKISTILNDAAQAVGETIDQTTLPTTRVGTAFVRPEGPASRVLELVASRAWFIGEDGITRLGKRATSTYTGKGLRGPLDQARGTLTLAAESILSVVPGVVVDGLEAVDVRHTVSLAGGLRSMLWGEMGKGADRRLEALRKIFDQLDPNRKFRGLASYRVVKSNAGRLDLQSVRASAGMPDLLRVPIMPGIAGGEVDPALGSIVLVAFVDGDPSQPKVVNFEGIESGAFAATSVNLRAGGQVGGEHVMTVEAMTVFMHNLLFALAQLPGGLTSGLAVSGAIPLVINGALAASAVPPPPDLIGQVNAAAAQAGTMPGPAVGATSALYKAAIDLALATKMPNVSGLFPNIGSKAVKSG